MQRVEGTTEMVVGSNKWYERLNFYLYFSRTNQYKTLLKTTCFRPQEEINL